MSLFYSLSGTNQQKCGGQPSALAWVGVLTNAWNIKSAPFINHWAPLPTNKSRQGKYLFSLLKFSVPHTSLPFPEILLTFLSLWNRPGLGLPQTSALHSTECIIRSLIYLKLLNFKVIKHRSRSELMHRRKRDGECTISLHSSVCTTLLTFIVWHCLLQGKGKQNQATREWNR